MFCGTCLSVCIGDFEKGLPCDLVVEAEREIVMSRTGLAGEEREAKGSRAPPSNTDPCPFCGKAEGWRKTKRSEKMPMGDLPTALGEPGEKGQPVDGGG